MTTFHSIVLVFHVIIGAMIVGLVLVQRGKGSETGAAFGSGASATVFGAKGSANFLSRSTAFLATCFFATSLGLAYLGSERPVAQSLVEEAPAGPAAQPAPGAGSLQAPPGDVPVLPSAPAAGGTPANGPAPAPPGTGKP